MPIQWEDDTRVERRRPQAATATIAPREPASRSLTAAPLASSFDVLQDAVAQLRLINAWLHHLRRQVRGAIAACEAGTLPTDLLSGMALVKLEQDVLKLERQINAVVRSSQQRLFCVQQGRHWLESHLVNEGSRR